MPVTSTDSREDYVGNGSTTEFPVSFYFLLDADLLVTLRVDATGVDTTQTLTTHYTVAGAGDQNGGAVTMLTPPAVGESLIITRDVAPTQETDYENPENFNLENAERNYDKLTMLIQQILETIDRVPQMPVGASASAIVFPEPAAEYVISWNAAGLALENGCTVAEVAAAAGNAATAVSAAADAADSETAAAASAAAAATAETNAETAETGSETAQAASEAAQALAETAQAAAEAAETEAEAAETVAIAQAAAASTSAGTATTQATASEASATDSETAQTAAEAAQAAAEAAQSAAETAETNAETAETNAETAEANAEAYVEVQCIYIPAQAWEADATSAPEETTIDYGNGKRRPAWLFDGTTAQWLTLYDKLPPNWDGSTFKIQADWDGAAGATPGDETRWAGAAHATGDDAAIDIALPAVAGVTDTLLAVGDHHEAGWLSITPTGSGKAVDTAFGRNPAHADDDMAEKAIFFGAMLKFKISGPVTF